MYSTCLFCQHDLGRNETFETFPVGRRIAYDLAHGRLWVVCRNCARWNLSPLEERWEAMEEAERRFRDTRLRAGTGEIALARLREGTDLVRIGRPPRLELAAWRYGDQFGRRRRRHLLVAGGVMAGGALAVAGALSAGVSALTAWQLANALHNGMKEGAPWSTVARLRGPDGRIIRVRPRHLRRTTLGVAEDGTLQVALHHAKRDPFRPRPEPLAYSGVEAERVLAKLLPAVNRMGGTREEVSFALGRLEHAGTTEQFFASLARRGARLTPVRGEFSWRRQLSAFHDDSEETSSGLYALPRTLSLAIEMAAHEQRERQAMEGELAELEAAWREAEEIARIADDLLLPDDVASRLAALRARAGLRGGGDPAR